MSPSLREVAEHAVSKGMGGPVRLRHAPREMNVGETRYAEFLEARRARGEVRKWRFESHRLRLGHGAWYKPDFYVLLADGSVEFHEYKGPIWREAARVRIKSAAALYPEYRFIGVQEGNFGYAIEEFRP